MYDNIDEKPYKQKKKMMFMEAGFELFSNRSIEAVKLQDVANASGFGIATLYRYFDNKSTLLLEIARWKWGAFFKENKKRRPRPELSVHTAADMFDYYLDTFVELYRTNKDLLRFNQFLNIYLRSEEAGTDTKRMYQRLLDPAAGFFHEMYEKARQDCTIRTDISEQEMFSATIHLMLAAITRYAVGLVYEPEGFDDVAELEMLKEMLLGRYRAEQTPDGCEVGDDGVIPGGF